jgi:hypothetical protein
MPYFGIPIRNGLPIGLGSVAGFGVQQFSPADLFSAGEQGAWYDPSDFSTLFTDSAGTTPVTAVEQFVGLMLDKRVPVAQTGYYSGVFDGSNDSLTLGTVSSFNFMHNPTALFTFECWVNVPSTASQLCIADNTSGTTAQTGFFVRILAGGAISLAITNSNGVSPSIVGGTSTSTISTNTWTHIAITYDHSLASANAKFYINGVAAGTSNKTAATPSSGNASQILLIGRFNGGGGEFNGYISNLRITNNIVYTGAFTPPTIPLTAVANTQLLTCQNSTFIDNSGNNFTITANGDAKTGAANPFGNHATQTTSAKRPKLAARYNLLQRTEEFDNGYWSRGNVLAFGSGSAANATTAPDGTVTADLLTPNTSANVKYLAYRDLTGTGGAFSVFGKPNGYNFLTLYFYDSARPGSVDGATFNISTGVFSNLQNAARPVTYSVAVANNGFYKITITTSLAYTQIGIVASNTANNTSGSDNLPTFTGDGTSGIYIWGADLRPASQATGLIGPAYQRVVDAATYDAVGFLPYLEFNGLSWSMSTGSIDFTATDKMTVWAGVRKQAAGTAQLVELSTAVASNAGAFSMPSDSGTNTWASFLGGSSSFVSAQASGYAAPITTVNAVSQNLALLSNEVILRVNGAQVATSGASDAGSGNYGNYPLFIGARNNASLFFNGWLTSLIIRGAQSTQGQIEATESWVNGKTGAY